MKTIKSLLIRLRLMYLRNSLSVTEFDFYRCETHERRLELADEYVDIHSKILELERKL